PGNSISNILLKFSDPTRVRFTFTSSVLAVDPPADSVAETNSLTRFDGGTVPRGTGRDPVAGDLGQPTGEVSAARLIDWFGSFDSGGHAGLGAGTPTVLSSARPWVRRFLLDLAEPVDAAGP